MRFVLSATADFLEKKGIESARLDAELLLAFLLKKDRLNLYISYDQPLTQKEIQAYKDLIRRRLSGEPVAYILGEKFFLKWRFKVTPEVLIPRPETELLVEKAVRCAESRGGRGHLLDLGVGCGAVAVSLAHYLQDSLIDAVDLSPQAVEVARENSIALGLDERITFYTGDLFTPLPEARKGGYMGIVSNPPYVPTKEISLLSQEVQSEPRLALDGGEDGLGVLRRILFKAREYLSPDGFLAFEHGAGQSASLQQMAYQSGFRTVFSYPDHAGLDRVMVCE